LIIEIDHEIEQATRYFRDKAKREGKPALSRLFTVLDHGGGWRFVITEFWQIKHHLTPGERAIKVPRVRIAEPVEWDDIARTIKLAERYATRKLATHNPCGDCKACCRILRIEDEKLHKPAFTSCPHLDSCVNGCGIYPSRPETCRRYECEWLKSQRVNDRMPLQLRPDHCGIIFQTATEANDFDPEAIEAHPDPQWPSNPFEGDRVKRHIAALMKYGLRVVAITHYVSEK
jgi:hypothetical protein